MTYKVTNSPKAGEARVRVIPRQGLKLRDPRNGAQIPDEDFIDPKTEKVVRAGVVMNMRDFEHSAFWQRRVKDQDVTTANEPAQEG